MAVTVTGTTVDAQTKAPLPSMTVAAYTSAGSLGGTGTTDSGGRYSISMPPGDYRLLAYDRNGLYATAFGNDADAFETSPVLSLSTDTSGLNFVMRRGGTAQGAVVGAMAGAPIAGATVAAYNMSGTRRGFTLTNGAGAYSLVLPPGTYKIAAYDEAGVYSARFYLDQSSFQTATNVAIVAAQPSAGINFQLEWAARLNGTVTDFATRSPLMGMTVIAFTEAGVPMATASTDANGQFVLSVAAGTYKIVATDTGFIYATGFLNDADAFISESTISVSPAEARLNVDFALHRAGTIAGTVSLVSSNVLPWMTVAAYNEDGTQRTTTRSDINGRYGLALPPATFRIAAYDDSLVYATQFYDHQNAFSGSTPLTISSSQNIDNVNFSMNRGARVSGVITDGAQGTVVEGITVAAFDSEGNKLASATTGANGTYSLIVPAGRYKFVAYDNALRYATAYPGHASTYEDAPTSDVSPDAPLTLDFVVMGGVRLTGTVVDTRSVALNGIEIAALDSQGRHVASAMTTDGIFKLVLLPNTYKVQAVDHKGRYYDAYFNGASSFAAADSIVVDPVKPADPITLIMLARLRRHAAGR